MKGFRTGCFNLNGSTTQKFHQYETYNDDVISWISNCDKEIHNDGYVSNVGSIVTIHISDMSDDSIKYVKKWFGLDNDEIDIIIEPFLGW